jgi:hypothetical protein
LVSRTQGPSSRVSGTRACRAGQAVVFLLLALTALVFVLLFNVDLHRIIQRKNQTQNAGDAAALAAARWQGASLNLVGELNLLHVLALANQQPAAVDAITNMQARLCFSGPMTALFAAQIAAKNNRMYVDPDMTSLLAEHAATVRSQYTSLFNGEMYFPEPWAGAWSDYADMLEQIAADGIAAGPDNAQFFTDPSDGHPLFNKAFYDAIDGEDWCWFYLFAPGLLDAYTSYHDWPPIPDADAGDYADSEIFGLGLLPFVTPMRLLFTADALADYVNDAGLGPVTDGALAATNVLHPAETWYVYNRGVWTGWDLIRPTGENAFPVTGPVRPEYDYAGADAVVRVYAGVDRLTPGTEGGNRSDKVVWSAAAKPFGYLGTDADKQRPDAAASFVLPAFRNVRLIPVDAASGSQYSTSDVEWVRHVRDHLRTYLDVGPQSSSSCRYCASLTVWEIAAFREEGSAWLEVNSGVCRIPTGGGGRHGGGSRRGH